MALKDDKNAQFHHYILDPARRARENKYMIFTIAALAVFFLWVASIFADPPKETMGHIPVICFVIFIVQTLYYAIVTCYWGGKVLDLKKDRDEGLLGPSAGK
ncbi:MAG: hypothetical protein LBP78_08535 [Acidaminococcales bacterium]|jgi:hypothetical protein|nr:hypothetical protein [Acidaminococcales bacterium]